MQMQLPLAVPRLIHTIVADKFAGPQADIFFRLGLYSDLPELGINLCIESLPCIPSEEMMNILLEELIAKVS